SLECTAEVSRHYFGCFLIDEASRIAKSDARLEVEADGDRGKLSEVIHSQRTDVRHQLGDSIERNKFPGARAYVESRQPRWVILILGKQFEDDVVLVARRIDGADLPVSVGGVKRVRDLIGRDAERVGFVAVDPHIELRILHLKIAGDVLQLRERAQSGFELGR